MLVNPIRILPTLPWSMGQLVVLTVLRCSPAGTMAGGSAPPWDAPTLTSNPPLTTCW
jgi:hypothetical protein